MWATHCIKDYYKDISGIFYMLYPVLECASIFLFLTLMTEINQKLKNLFNPYHSH